MWFVSLTNNMHFRCMTGVCTWWWVRNTSLQMMPMKCGTESNIPLKSPFFRSANPRTRMSSLPRQCLHICESSTRLQWKSTSSSSVNTPARNTHTAHTTHQLWKCPGPPVRGSENVSWIYCKLFATDMGCSRCFSIGGKERWSVHIYKYNSLPETCSCELD